MKRYSKAHIDFYAKGVYTVLIATHGLSNTKKILTAINKMTKSETKRRKEKE